MQTERHMSPCLIRHTGLSGPTHPTGPVLANPQSVMSSNISVTRAAMGERSDRVRVMCAKSG